MRKIILVFIIFLFTFLLFSENLGGKVTVARIKYSGGGDWYNDPNILPNLLKYFNKETGIKVWLDKKVVSILDDNLFDYPIIFITGHGNISFSDNEIDRLRTYLEGGGFLYIDDDYGLDKSIRRELKRLYPEKKMVELPSDFVMNSIYFNLKKLPKIHKHNNKSPKAYGIFLNGRLAIYYTYETNISDGWTKAHNDPKNIRELALKMGTNILIYAILN